MSFLKWIKYWVKKVIYIISGPEVFSAKDSFEVELMKRFLKKGDTAIDVGANAGIYTQVMAHSVGDEGRIYAFEPSPKTYKILERNLAKFSNTILSNSAVGSSNGTANFYVTYQSGLSGLGDTGRGTVLHTENVPLIRLDDYLKEKQIRKVDFLKIDVEGFEGDVLRGAENLLRQCSPVIMVELDKKNFAAHGFSRKEVFYFMSNLGYEAYSINRAERSLNKFDKNGENKSVNFLFIRKNNTKIQEFIKV